MRHVTLQITCLSILSSVSLKTAHILIHGHVIISLNGLAMQVWRDFHDNISIVSIIAICDIKFEIIQNIQFRHM